MESLQGLPSFNGDNFSRYNYQPHRVNSSRPTPYLSVVSSDSNQHHCLPIVSKREHYVINFLERQWDKRQKERAAAKAKRSVHAATTSASTSTATAVATPETEERRIPQTAHCPETVSLDRSGFEASGAKESNAAHASNTEFGSEDEGPAPKLTRRSPRDDGTSDSHGGSQSLR